MSALRENTSFNFPDVKNVEVADNARASETVSLAYTFSKIDFELTDFTVQDATPVLVTSSSPMQSKEKPTIDIDQTKNSDTLKEPLQIYTKETENLWTEGENALEKSKSLENTSFS